VSNRQATLITALKKRLIETDEQVKTLQVACSQFGEEFDEAGFIEAWNSSDRKVKLTALAVQAAYENSINGAIRIAQELSELAGWTEPNREPSSVDALKALRENGVIPSAAVHRQLKDAYEERSTLQHDYANTLARDIHEQAKATLDAVPAMLQEAHLFITRNF
jgi:hypothetical protein